MVIVLRAGQQIVLRVAVVLAAVIVVMDTGRHIRRLPTIAQEAAAFPVVAGVRTVLTQNHGGQAQHLPLFTRQQK